MTAIFESTKTESLDRLLVDIGEDTKPGPQTVFSRYIDARTGPIGRVVGSEQEPAGAHTFAMWASDTAMTLDVGHIVVTFSEEAAVIGVIDEPRRFSDLRSFLDDYFDRHMEEAIAVELATRRPEILVFVVRVLATCHLRADVDSHRPAVSGPVWFATPEAIDFALGRDDFRNHGSAFRIVAQRATPLGQQGLACSRDDGKVLAMDQSQDAHFPSRLQRCQVR